MSRLVIDRAHTNINITNNTKMNHIKILFLLIEFPTNVKISLVSPHMRKVIFTAEKCEK